MHRQIIPSPPPKHNPFLRPYDKYPNSPTNSPNPIPKASCALSAAFRAANS
ncbi:hypothetical protein HYW29_01320 [Candidatus Amesbacteria bacterium]|nr:hypothetical protein [Candidatus Amesbacteria bacterium]